jgi:hypothetical protein
LQGVLGSSTAVVDQLRVFFWVSARVMVKCSDVPEERTVSIFRVDELVKMDAKVMQRTQFFSDRSTHS